VAAIQNRIVKPTTDAISVQKKALIDRVCLMIEAAAMEKTNIVCMQEIWNAPFFMCTRERYPWVEFSEPVNGESTQILSQLAKKHNIVILNSILER
jgi:beta-ureidopropionase